MSSEKSSYIIRLIYYMYIFIYLYSTKCIINKSKFSLKNNLYIIKLSFKLYLIKLLYYIIYIIYNILYNILIYI